MTRTILLADDSVTIQKVVELTFLEEDIDVVSVGSGDEALARLDEVTPLLVIADVHMPGADGYEVCRQVKSRGDAIPVLLLVGTFEPFDPGSVEECGAEGHLKKPFDSQELLKQALDLMGLTETVVRGGDDKRVSAVSVPAVGRSTPPEETAAAATPTVDETQEEAGDRTRLSDDDIERVARRVVELLADDTVREVAWEVVPDLAEVVIRDRIRDLESQVE